MSTSTAGYEAFDAKTELDNFSHGAYLAERNRRYHARLADEGEAACSKIEAQIEGLRQSLATRRAEVTENRRAAAETGA